jgi:GNAT superfamily N-acetyltransferase
MAADEPVEAYEGIFEEKLARFEQAHALKDPYEKRLSYVCLDHDQFVGGIVGKSAMDNLYVDLLFVRQNARKQGIANQLMELVEQEAKAMGITQSYLGTGSFQAPGLDRKLGYEIVMTVEDFPRNFSNHTLVKAL